MKTFGFAGLMVVLSFVVAGCATNPVTGQRQLSFISESQEIKMGADAAPEFEQQFGGRVPNEKLQQYVTDLGMKLANLSERPKLPWTFVVLKSDIPNAFALPGGKVFVTAGLMTSLTNERQLASVLGHEIGHVCAMHSVTGMQRAMGAEAFAMLIEKASGNESYGTATKVAGQMVVLKYGRDDEYQADALGIKYMEKAGYNPWGMVETLQFLMTLGEEGGRLDELFQTHPLSSERVKAAHNNVTKNYASYHTGTPDPNEARFRQMQALCPK